MGTTDRTILSRFVPLGHKVEKATATFSLEDLQAPFSLLFGGLVLSGVVLGVELMVHQWNKCGRDGKDSMKIKGMRKELKAGGRDSLRYRRNYVKVRWILR